MRFNPFVPHGIAYQGMFIGREEEISTIQQALFQTANDNPQHLLISGERGIGKTSLLNVSDFVARGDIRIEADFNFLTVSSDLAGVNDQVGIVRQIARELRSKLNQFEPLKAKLSSAWEFISNWEILGVSYNRDENSIDPDTALDELISLFVSIVEKQEFQGILVLLDEADTAPVEANLGEFVKVATERLAKRSVFNVSFVLAGQSILLNKLRESHESSVRLFQILDMMPLSMDERIEVVNSGLELANKRNEVDTSITDEAIELIASLSEGYPHFLQQFAYSAFEADDDNQISREDVLRGTVAENGAIAQLGKKYFSEMYFSKIWSNDYRKVLDFMADYGDNWVQRKDILQESGVSERTVDNALKALKDREIIVSDEVRKGFYRLPTRSFATWITVVKATE